MISALHTLLKNHCTVTTYGLYGDIAGARSAPSVEEAVNNADAILLPLPFSTDGINVFAPFSQKEIKITTLLSRLTPNQVILGGKLSPQFCDEAVRKGCSLFDYYTSERLTLLNAVATAEGALAIAINETPFTLFNSNCTIFGYGRIGKMLAGMLKALGASVSVCARNPDALTWAEINGCHAIPLENAKSEISGADVIFNTIPKVIIDKEILDNTKSECIIIDLASAPGGIDGSYAKQLPRKVIYALSLPGKVAPQSAGSIIADTVIRRLNGGGAL